MRFLIVFLLLLMPLSSFAKENTYNYSGFLGAGTGFSFPGPIRFRFYDTELGTYGVALGAAKSFRGEHQYFLLGGGLSAVGRSQFGLIGAIGTEYIFLWNLGVRGEFFTFFGIGGIAYSGATVGLSLNF